MAQASAMDPRQFLQALFASAVSACAAAGRIASRLPPAPPGRTVAVGAGKAAAAMAAEVERHWRGDLSGLVAVPYGHGVPLCGSSWWRRPIPCPTGPVPPPPGA